MSNHYDAPVSKKANSFQDLPCSLCDRITIHYKGICKNHSTFPKPASLGGRIVEVDSTPVNRQPKSKALYEPKLPTKSSKLDPNNILCVGCGSEISKAFNLPGKAWKGKSVIRSAKTELVWNPTTGETRIDVIEKSSPIDSYRSGILCASCCSDYTVIERIHKDGSKTWVPKIIPDKSVTEHDTLGSASVKAGTVNTNPAKFYRDWQVENGIKVDTSIPDYMNHKPKGKW